jgi:hypothetical protein
MMPEVGNHRLERAFDVSSEEKFRSLLLTILDKIYGELRSMREYQQAEEEGEGE